MKNYLNKLFLLVFAALIAVQCTEEDPQPENQAPSISGQTFSIDENSPNGTIVGTIVASDPEGGNLTFSISSGNTDNAFGLNATSGSLTVGNMTVLDFETTPVFTLAVEVSDGEFQESATITINLTDVDESTETNTAPAISDQSFSIDENSASGTSIGTVVASDADGDALTFSILSGNTGDVFVISDGGELTVKTSELLDFEATPTFTLEVRVSDGTAESTAMITINLNDIMEGGTAPGLNEVRLNSVLYTLSDGMIFDYGISDPTDFDEDTHINYYFNMIDKGEFQEESFGPFDEISIDASDFGIEIGVDLYSSGTSSFQTGVFEYSDFNSSVSGSNVFYFEVETLSNGVERYYTATSGTVTVSGSSASYTLEIDLKLVDQEQPGSAEMPFVGNYTFTTEPYSYIDERLEIGDPFFTVDPGAGFNNISHSAWTGSKLWAVSSLCIDGGCDGSTPQVLLEINPATGDALQTITPTQPIWSLDYANGFLWDISSFQNANNPLEQFNAETGAYIGQWGGSSTYDIDYFWTHNGTGYYGSSNFDCGGFNCQSLVVVDDSGVIDTPYGDNINLPSDLEFGGGFFWAAMYDGRILKLNSSLEQVAVYQITNWSEVFGEAQFANEIPGQLNYINGELWIMDRDNNFYKTGIQ